MRMLETAELLASHVRAGALPAVLLGCLQFCFQKKGHLISNLWFSMSLSTRSKSGLLQPHC